MNSPSSSVASSTAVPVAFVLKGYPRLSETFIAQEIAALEQRGLEIMIVSLRHPTDKKRHALNDAIRAPLLYLPEYLYQEPLRVLRGWWKARQLPGYGETRKLWWRDLLRDPTPNRGRRLGQALVLAAELPARYRHIHAHFVHTPGSVARYAAHLLGLPWTASAHARDLWTTPPWEKQEKFADCQWAVTCNAHNIAHLNGIGAADKVSLLYHGIDTSRFPPPPASRPPRDGSSADPVRIVSVGRAVAKKGYDILLDALSLLPHGLNWQFEHIGGGPLLPKLKEQAAKLGLAERIVWRGAQAQDAVIEAYRHADLFVLASRRDADGDMDGLPNVLMEAQSQGLACVSTDLSAIPELIEQGRTGLMVPPEDAAALGAAMEQLIRDPAKRDAIGKAGAERVRGQFSMQAGIDELARRFGLGAAARPQA